MNFFGVQKNKMVPPNYSAEEFQNDISDFFIIKQIILTIPMNHLSFYIEKANERAFKNILRYMNNV